MSGCACGGGGDEAYMDENARHARKLLNEIDIKSKMKKYDANE